MPMEVMGLMLGEFVDDYTVRVVDVFAMPQSGTGVSVEAVDPVFQTKMLDMLKQVGRCAALPTLCAFSVDTRCCCCAKRPHQVVTAQADNHCLAALCLAWAALVRQQHAILPSSADSQQACGGQLLWPPSGLV